MDLAEYNIISDICRNICKDPNLIDDLIQEVALIWVELDPVKKEAIYKSQSFKWWTIKVVQQQWASSTSPFYSKYRKSQSQEFQEYHRHQEIEEQNNEYQYEAIEKHIDILFPSEYNIFTSYHLLGLTIMQIVDKYGIDKNFVWNTLQRVTRSIRRKTRWDLEGWSKQELRDLIQGYTTKRKLKAEERQIILDVNYALTDSKFSNIHDKAQVQKILIDLESRLK